MMVASSASSGTPFELFVSGDRIRPAREILVATDFSEIAEAAIAVAHAYALGFGARLHVFHVTWPEERGLADLFARLVEQLGTSVPVLVASHGGDAADEIVRYAQQHAIDLIVVGTHGRTGVTRALLGSVAERVIRTAPCPVLTVPARTAHPAEVPNGGMNATANVPTDDPYLCRDDGERPR